ncbi:MAG: M12 family metallo-peptidase [Acidobacteriota bacterium]
MTKHRIWIAAVLAFASTPLLAASPGSAVKGPVRAAAMGELIQAKGTSERAEIVTFGSELVPALLEAREDAAVHVSDWPVGPDERADVVLRRRDVYAPGAKVIVVDGKGQHEIPKSRLAFFSGAGENDSDLRVFAAVDPDTGSVNGFVQTRDALHELHPLSEVPSLAKTATAGSRKHLVAPPEVFRAERGESGEFTCGQNGAPLSFLEERDRIQQMAADAAGTDSIFASAISTLHTATLAVDTDNEFMNLKFANNTTTATNYIASLIASMTVIYERDALVRLLQGTTYLRVSTTPDPYNDVSSGNANPSKLQELSNVWNTTYAAIPRAVVMMLSGKQSGGGASGIAWVNTLCSKYYGTSFSQVFVSGTTPSSGDVLVVAHEIGHNFGSPHTHCYSTPIDNCYNAESGCYAGTKSCPASQTINGVTSVTGTLMSYCHLSGLSGCTSKTVFHPRTISEKLGPSIQAATQGASACIFPLGNPTPAPTVTVVSPASGSTAGGTAIALTGTGFLAGATVTVGGTAATSVVVVNSTRITAVAPAHAAGTVSVVVTNPDTQAGTLNPGFFYAGASTAGDLYTVTPCRMIDTRNANGPLGGPELSAGQVRTFTVTGSCSIPADAKALAVNVTAVLPGADGNLQIFPGNAFPLGTSTINFSTGLNQANNATLTLATNGAGTIGVKNGSTGVVDFLLDVVGYYK